MGKISSDGCAMKTGFSQKIIVWTNPDTTKSFPAQKILCGLSDASFVVVVFKYHTTIDRYITRVYPMCGIYFEAESYIYHPGKGGRFVTYDPEGIELSLLYDNTNAKEITSLGQMTTIADYHIPVQIVKFC